MIWAMGKATIGIKDVMGNGKAVVIQYTAMITKMYRQFMALGLVWSIHKIQTSNAGAKKMTQVLQNRPQQFFNMTDQ